MIIETTQLLVCICLPMQAQLILGMLTQPMLQTPNIRQSAAPKLQPLVLDSQQSQQLATQSLLGLPPLPPSLLPQSQPQTQLAQSQNQVLQSQLPKPSRNPSINATQVSVSINPPVQVGTSVAVKQQMQPFFLQQAGAVASMNFTYNSQLGTEKTRYHPPTSSMHTPSLEQGSQGNPSVVSGVLDNTNKDSRRPQAPNNSSLITRPAYPSGLPEVKRGAAYYLDLLSRPSKMARLNDGISYALPDASVSTPQSGCSTQVLSAAEMSNPDKQATQVQLPSDVESALLQQVLSLTPEQLSALPPDQQQQVIQLQQMLRQPT
ncbi:hypothetical protein H5410_007157 [Solanum commersonii]|uniref:Transcription termination and cleavage factor C-terminal domain-containing protein n=1 Tax=Solanum commersonii TaxID=4109 RepID=A0A9J6ACB4_SOLCO|nr:hypothetical protein H5410_007157 [Solanum commersonii]